jgi:hypothetical protein
MFYLDSWFLGSCVEENSRTVSRRKECSGVCENAKAEYNIGVSRSARVLSTYLSYRGK